MRLARALLLSAFLLLLEVAAWSEPTTPTIPEFSQAKSWQITYTYVPAGPSLSGRATVIVSYSAPDRVRVEDNGPNAFVAVSDRESIHVLRPKQRVAMWVPAVYSLSAPSVEITLGGSRGPLMMDWEEVRAGLRSPGGRLGNATYELLPEQTVAGRRCLVIRTTTRSGLPTESKDWVVTRWFDAEYGLPLAMQNTSGQHPIKVRAARVLISPSHDAKVFTFTAPRGIPVFRGSLDCCALNGLGVARAEPDPDDALWDSTPSIPGITSVLTPVRVPAGFRSIRTPMTEWQEGDEAHNWCYTQRWFSESGGVISLTQGAGTIEESHSRLEGDAQPLTIRGKTGELLAYHVPFEGLVLTWEDGKRWFKLEGTGVTAGGLAKMAEAMKEVNLGAPREDQEEGGD
jgi:outer membrane lipoprotein-sorting protein